MLADTYLFNYKKLFEFPDVFTLCSLNIKVQLEIVKVLPCLELLQHKDFSALKSSFLVSFVSTKLAQHIRTIIVRNSV